MERIALTIEEYHEIRRLPTHFFVRPGHVYPDFERVIAEPDGYVIVEKFGDAGKKQSRSLARGFRLAIAGLHRLVARKSSCHPLSDRRTDLRFRPHRHPSET